MSKITKKQKKLQELLEGFEQPTSGKEALTKLQEVSKEVAKFNETVEIHVKLGIDPTKSDQTVRGTVVLPNGTGKTPKIIAFVKADKEKEALDAGAEAAGADDLIAKVKAGYSDFEICVATPDMMGPIGKGLGRLLAAKMPNPKAGTVTKDIGKTIKELRLGKIQYRADKQGIIHSSVGKRDFGKDKILQNIATLLDAVIKAKPSAAKGTYIKSVVLTSTMGPSVRVDPLKVPAFLQGRDN